MVIDSKKRLAIKLSKIKKPKKLKLKYEQYLTPSEEAARMLWQIRKKIKGEIIADLGAGHGILGIGALLLGAKKIYFVEKDKEMMKFLKQNLSHFNFSQKQYNILNEDISKFNQSVDFVIMNPPFGTHKKGYDKKFIDKGLDVSNKVYTLLSKNSEEWVRNNYDSRKIDEFDIKLHYSKFFHTKPSKNFEVIFVKIIS